MSDFAAPSLTSALARVLRVSTTMAASEFSSTPVDQSAHATSGGCGWGRGHNFPLCIHCSRTNHPSERSWQKFGKPETAKPTVVNPTSAVLISETMSDVITLRRSMIDYCSHVPLHSLHLHLLDLCQLLPMVSPGF